MKHVFVLNGLPGVGKTLFGALVKQEAEKNNINFIHTSSIYPIKHLLLPSSQWSYTFVPEELRNNFKNLKKQVTSIDWDGKTKNVYWRGVMSEYKKVVTEAYPNYINYWILQQLNVKEPVVLFVDIREPENIESFRNYCLEHDEGIFFNTILVESDLNEEFDNESDASVFDYEYDIKISNKRKSISDEIACKRLTESARYFFNEFCIQKSGRVEHI